MKDEIAARLRANLARVDRLLELYKRDAGPGQGRRAVDTIDLLRAAVVFLHATLEDFVRSVQTARWPDTQDREHLDRVEVSLTPGTSREKVTLADLLVHRGKRIDDVIRQSIEAHLERASYNNLGDLKMALARSGLDPALVAPHEKAVAAMMSRRHRIVHRADRHDVGGSGNHGVASLGAGTVETWKSAVHGLCAAVVAQL